MKGEIDFLEEFDRAKIMYKQIVNRIETPEVLLDKIKTIGECYLISYNSKPQKGYPHAKLLKEKFLSNSEFYYGLLRNRAIELNVDLSKYPQTLEELTK
jgi:hypothetical protein